MQHRNALAVVVILLALVAAGCGAAAGSQSPSALPTSSATQAGYEPTQRDEGGEVTVEVTWNGPAAGAVFDVTLDTHSVDLDPLDLTDAVLTNDRGGTLGAKAWEAPKGGHHREGRLAFEGDVSKFLADTSFIELKISSVGAVPERVLRWEVPS
jgi:hypothetical protein